MTSVSSLSVADLVDHERYPMNDLNDPAMRAVIERCRDELRDHDVCTVHGFLHADALTQIVDEVGELAVNGYQRPGLRTCYVWSEPEPGFPDDHPRCRMLRHSTRIVSYDQIRDWTVLDRLYRWEPLREMLAAILGKDRLFLHDCPHQALNVLAFQDGDESSWHFDPDNEYTVTLLLQSAATGGDFEIAPKIRSADDPAYDAIQGVLDGDSKRVIGVERNAGSLVIFFGRNSLHRVSPVHGDRPRLVAVMCYETEPGVVGTDELNAAIYGPRLAAMKGLPAS